MELRVWNEAKKNQSLIAALSTVPQILPTRIFSTLGVTCFNPYFPEITDRLLQQPMIKSVVVLDSFDGTENEKMPWKNFDIVIPAIKKASEISESVDKLVIATAVDHLTNLVYPLAVFGNYGTTLELAIPSNHVINMEERRIYPSMPSITEEKLTKIEGTDVYYQRLRLNQRSYSELTEDEKKRLADKQKVANPHTIILTTDLRPAAVRYPSFFGHFNSHISINIPVVLNDQGEVDNIDWDSVPKIVPGLISLLDQASSAEEGKPYSNTVNILIEAQNIEMAKGTLSLIATDALRTWAVSGGKNIIFAKVESGVTKEIEAYPPSEIFS